MTQEAVLKALQDSPLTSHQVAKETGMSQATVISTARKLKEKGEITISKVKSGRYWLAQYELTKKAPEVGQTVFYGIQTQGLFTKAEYAQMKAQATRLLGKPAKKEITNHQFI